MAREEEYRDISRYRKTARNKQKTKAEREKEYLFPYKKN